MALNLSKEQCATSRSLNQESVELFDQCELKDGRIGWIVEILGNHEAYMVELDKKGLQDRIVTVTPEEVVQKIK